jgi:fumarate reductase subunit C
MWGHMFFVSSILLGKDAMWHVTKFFEGYLHLRPRHALAGVVRGGRGAGVLFIGHALLAVRKFPISYRQYRAFADHKNAHAPWRHHAVVVAGDHRLRAVLPGSVHLYIMLTQPETIGPYGSADRMWTDRTCGRCTWCCCLRWNCTAASACTG